MFLKEIFAREEDSDDFRSPDEDNSVAKKSDTRKTRLTLKHLNKMRKMDDQRTVEQNEKILKIQAQYAVPSEEAEPAF